MKKIEILIECKEDETTVTVSPQDTPLSSAMAVLEQVYTNMVEKYDDGKLCADCIKHETGCRECDDIAYQD